MPKFQPILCILTIHYLKGGLNLFFNKKFKLLKEVLEDSKEFLSIDDYENATVLIDNNESLLGLELICEQLYEYDSKIPKSLYEKVENLGKYYELDCKKLDLISQLIVNDR
nr:MafI family immunity protein [Candidatus Parabeggiatoa sp.]